MSNRSARLGAPVLVLSLAAIVLLLTSIVSAEFPRSQPLPPGVTVSTVVAYGGPGDDDFPTAMAFLPDGRLLFTEKGGFNETPHQTRVRVIENGALREQAWLTLTVVSNSERGLLGIAADPDFETNPHIYLFYTHPATQTGGLPFNRVSRFADVGGVGVSETALLDIPEVDNEPNHNGGNLHFGPDGKLYVSVGESGGTPSRAQELTSVYGKILRLNKEDGTAPLDNPFYDGFGPNEDRIWAYGLRNPFDFDFDADSGRMFTADNGPQCNDEINWVQPGRNYGWPHDADYAGTCAYFGHPAYVPPLYVWSSTIAPAGIAVYDGDDVPDWQADLLLCASNTSTLYRARLTASRDAVLSADAVSLPAGAYCGTDVEVAPDGSIYLLAWIVGDGQPPNRIVRLSGPADLRLSRKSIAPADPLPGGIVTYTINVINSGSASSTFTLTDTFPLSATLITGSPAVTSGSLISTSQSLTWTGTITANTALKLTFLMQVSPDIVSPTLIHNAAHLTGAGAARNLSVAVMIFGERVVLPLALKNAFP